MNKPKTQNITSPIVEPSNASRSAEAVGNGTGGVVDVGRSVVLSLSIVGDAATERIR